METDTAVQREGTGSRSVVQLKQYIGGRWVESASADRLDVVNPADQKLLARVPAGAVGDVGAAVAVAAKAFPAWRRTPPEERIQYLFRLKTLLHQHYDELAALITQENGKVLAESKGELQRAIENVEVACGIPTLMQGQVLEDVAAGIDELMIRQPLGVVAAITPFNFPVMVPFWFLPYAIACGNTFILKPSEKVPVAIARLFELMEELELPAGVLNLVHGAKPAVDALLDHPTVRAISFVGSTPVAKYVYARGSTSGKRVQAQGGAKNHVLVLPDADMEMTTKIIAESAYGCAGQRCLAVSVAVTVGEARKQFRDAIVSSAQAIRVGDGLKPETQMGPVITPESRSRIHGLMARAANEGAKLVAGGPDDRLGPGNFIPATVLDDVEPASALADTEIFGPVLSLVHVDSVEDGLKVLEKSAYGNAASIFTTSGAAARKFRYEAPAGNIGVNIGVAAPMAYFPFSGWKDSFFGVVHAQGRDAIEFYTDKKVVVERWPKDWSRRF